MPNIVDSTVVASAYQTSASARPQMLSNGWIVTAEINGTTDIRFQVSKDNGVTFIPLCYSTFGFVAPAILSVCSVGTVVHFIFTNSGSCLHLWFDAITVANVNIYGATGKLQSVDYSQNSTGGCSLAINSLGTELHACWSSKNATYPNSFNIRYAKGVISSVDGSVTWGTVEQSTNATNSTYHYKNPSIILDKNSNPVILFEFTIVSHMYIGAIGKSLTDDGNFYVVAPWKGKVVYDGGTYAQSSPSAIFVPQSINGLANGRIWVAWHGKDATNTSVDNIRVSYSDDLGSTWSAMEKLTSGNTRSKTNVSITANKSNKIYILWHGYSDTSITNRQVEKISFDGVWSSITKVTSYTDDGYRYPSSLYDSTFTFTEPLFVYSSTAKVGFYGSWTVTTISVTQGNIGSKSDKSNLLEYAITTDGIMGTITESVNGVSVGTKTLTSGASSIVGLSQAQWDDIKYGKYASVSTNNTLTIGMGTETFTYTFDKRLATTDDITSAMKAVQDSQSVMLPSVKAKLGSAIRSNGGSVNDGDSFDAMVSAIMSNTDKKWASGSLTTVLGGASIFHLTNGGAVTRTVVHVTGLDFTPSIIYMYNGLLLIGTFFTILKDGTKKYCLTPTNEKIYVEEIGTYADGLVKYGTFFLPAGSSASNVDWIAIE